MADLVAVEQRCVRSHALVFFSFFFVFLFLFSLEVPARVF